MSRAGRRARLHRLIAAEQRIPAQQWTPGAVLDAARTKTEDERLAALIADRDAWLTAHGTTGWTAEQARRRAVRNARLRQQRQARNTTTRRTP